MTISAISRRHLLQSADESQQLRLEHRPVVSEDRSEIRRPLGSVVTAERRTGGGETEILHVLATLRLNQVEAQGPSFSVCGVRVDLKRTIGGDQRGQQRQRDHDRGEQSVGGQHRHGRQGEHKSEKTRTAEFLP